MIRLVTATGSNSRSIHIGCPSCFCGELPTRDGRCDYHAGMWDMYRQFEMTLAPVAGDRIDADALGLAWICMEHRLYCEGFPEYEDY